MCASGWDYMFKVMHLFVCNQLYNERAPAPNTTPTRQLCDDSGSKYGAALRFGTDTSKGCYGGYFKGLLLGDRDPGMAAS